MWQPIETAPKDGTWILVFGVGPDYGQPVEVENECKMAVAQYTETRNGQKVPGHWQFAWYDGGYYGEFLTPVRWMPLPEVPAY